LSNPGSAIKGESIGSAPAGTVIGFDAVGIDYGAKGNASIGSQSAGAGAGKAQPATIVVTKLLDKLSPTLLSATGANQVFRKGLIVVPSAGGKGSDLRLQLVDVVITSDHITSSAGAKPLEQLTLSALGVKIQEVPSGQVNSGVNQPLPAGWNRVLNTADTSSSPA
jgi:type VI protein secretion system component Hcp